MENIVLTIGGLLKSFKLSDLFFFTSILILIILLVYIVYLMRTEDKEGSSKKRQIKETSLRDIVDNLENNYEPKPVNMTNYEKAQEKSAVISYDELLEKTMTDIPYSEDYDNYLRKDSSSYKKDDLYQEAKNKTNEEYESEEAFLKNLKNLQDNLVR